MTMEADLTTLLKTIVPRTFPDIADTSTQRPYCTYQALGGQSLRWMDGTPADKRHTLMQVNVWADSRTSALTLMRSIEATICNLDAVPFMCQPESEPASTVETDVTPTLYGCRQDFRIISTR